MNVILYKRVSTDEQAESGFSLPHQEMIMKKYCEINHHNIIDIISEDYSAKTFDRPEWNKLMDLLKKNRGKVDLILCNRWDRFSRNEYDAKTVIRELHKLGVTVNTVEQPLDLTNPENKLLLNLYLTLPEIENDKISMRTSEGSWRARNEGCWTAQAPKGYDNFSDGKKSTLRSNTEAPLMIEAFKMLASGTYSADEVRKWLNDNKFKISKNTFLRCIRNPVYIGKIRTGAWKKEPSQDVIGLHPRLISDEIFYRANDVLEGRKRNMKFHDDKSDLYPLKGLLKCPEHHRSLTAYACRSHTGKLHHYYLCCKDRCTQRHRIQDVHESIEDILSDISCSAQIVNLYKKTLEKLFEKDDYQRKDEIQKTRKELERLELRKSNLQNDLMDRVITSHDYQDMKGRVEREVVLVKNKLTDLQQEVSPFRIYIQKEVPLLENLMEYYRKSDGVTKKKILNTIFAEKLIVINGKVIEPIFTEPIKLMLRISKSISNSKEKKEVSIDLKLLTSYQS
ncbi:MAG: recombinase family protein [Bacteroidia bacterium]|nr:recombinase family protein [Bacteroidia bacterium]